MVNSFLVIFVSGSSFTRGFTEEKIADYKKATEQIAGLKQQATALKDEIELLKLTRALIAEYVGVPHAGGP